MARELVDAANKAEQWVANERAIVDEARRLHNRCVTGPPWADDDNEWNRIGCEVRCAFVQLARELAAIREDKAVKS